jgi:hypothetical protein
MTRRLRNLIFNATVLLAVALVSAAAGAGIALGWHVVSGQFRP